MPLKPPKYVDTVRRLIYWQYAQLIAKAAGFEGNYGFVISRYKKLESGEMSWSSSIRDYEKELEKGRVCVYCGATGSLSTDTSSQSQEQVLTPGLPLSLTRPITVSVRARNATRAKGIGTSLSGTGLSAWMIFPSLLFRSFSSWPIESMKCRAPWT